MAKLIPYTTSFSNLLVEIEYEDGITIMDIWDVYEVISIYQGRASYYNTIIMSPNDRLDLLANRLYGTPTLWWFILLFNDIVDPFTAFDQNAAGFERTMRVIKPQYISEIFYAIKRFNLRKQSI